MSIKKNTMITSVIVCTSVIMFSFQNCTGSDVSFSNDIPISKESLDLALDSNIEIAPKTDQLIVLETMEEKGADVSEEIKVLKDKIIKEEIDQKVVEVLPSITESILTEVPDSRESIESIVEVIDNGSTVTFSAKPELKDYLCPSKGKVEKYMVCLINRAQQQSKCLPKHMVEGIVEHFGPGTDRPMNYMGKCVEQ